MAGKPVNARSAREALARGLDAVEAVLGAAPSGPGDAGGNGDAEAAFAALDAQGFLLGPGESARAAIVRGRALVAALRRLDDARPGTSLDGGRTPLHPEDRIPPGILREASDRTEALYGFRLEWAPGYFARSGVGPLWGGCAVSDPETGAVALLLREEFRKRPRYGLYDRLEIAAHELCHTARTPFDGDLRLEEFFAYQTSASALRRYLGNCFVTTTDAYIFALPAVATACVQAVRVGLGREWPMWPFWTMAAAGPLWLGIRNHFARRRLFRASAALKAAGVARPEPVLFRSVWDELPALTRAARAGAPSLAEYVAGLDEPRWRVIARRFLNGRAG